MYIRLNTYLLLSFYESEWMCFVWMIVLSDEIRLCGFSFAVDMVRIYIHLCIYVYIHEYMYEIYIDIILYEYICIPIPNVV
jgi:hypothetical protein